MIRKAHMTPGHLATMQAKVGIVVVVLFLLFGLAFGLIVLNETPSSEIGLKFLIGAFFLVWVAACISIIVIFARVLTKQKTPQEKSLVNLYFEEPRDMTATKNGDFESRLRKLEQLKQDGMITEEEYQVKRAQILGEKW